jgi:hypothetical protein
MAKDVKIYDGATWQSIKGPQGDDGAKGDAGVPGPTAVSTDANNVVELGADGLLKLDPAKLDSRFVNLTGDTMTGPLIVKPAVGPTNPDGGLQVIGDNTNASLSVKTAHTVNGNAALRFARSRGTTANPLPVQNSDQLGQITFQALRADSTYSSLVSFAVLVAADADVSGAQIKGRLNVNVNDGAGVKTPMTIDGTLVTFQFPVAINGGLTGNLALVNDAQIVAGTQTVIQVSETLVKFFKPVALTNGLTGDLVVLPGGKIFAQDGIIQATRVGVDNTIGIAAGSFRSTGTGKTVVGLACSVGGTDGGEDFTAALQVGNTVDEPTSYAIYSGSIAQSVIQGKLGLNRFVPTHQLDVGGDAIVRGPFEVVGNTTTTGTISTSGVVTVKPTAAATAGTGHIQVVGGAGAFQPVVSGVGYGTGTVQPVFRMARARGTAEAPESVQANDALGQVNFQGCGPDGVFRALANINVNCDATPAAGATQIRGRMSLLVNDGTGIKTPVTFYGDRVDLTVPLKLPATATTPSISATGATSGITMGPDTWGFMSSAGVNRSLWTVSATQSNYVIDTPSADPSAVTSILLKTAGNQVSLRAQQNGFDTLVSGSAGGLVVGTSSTSNGELAFQTNGLVRSTISDDGNLGVGWLAPTHRLEVFGTTFLRGTCEITGNITSAGTAHSFANGSIPSPAVIGNIPRTIAATGSAGSAGQMVWDDNFIYLHTTSGWKKVALTAI